MRRSGLGCIWVAAFLACANAALGQQPSSSAFATASGVAVDSVRGGYLRDAIVNVVGTNRIAVTDSLGRFQIDSVPAGSYQLRLSHAFLDTLGLSVMTKLNAFVAGGVTNFLLSIPSPPTIVARKCSSDDSNRGGSALAGVVLDADTEMPVTDAEVVVGWVDIEVGKKMINKTPRSRTARTHADGSYFICGIPSDLAAGVIARRGNDSTAAVPIDFSHLLAVQTFLVPSSRDSAVGKSQGLNVGRVTLVGSVLAPNGKPVAGARVAVDADDAVTQTAADGRFLLSGVRAGTRLASVRKIGWEPIEQTINVGRTKSPDLQLHFKNTVNVLETVKVTAMQDLGLQRVGFSERQKWGMGKFFTPNRLLKKVM